MPRVENDEVHERLNTAARSMLIDEVHGCLNPVVMILLDAQAVRKKHT